jgi:hypothetical protein
VIDLAAWVDVEELTVWQAACLWTGILPTGRDELPPPAQTVVARRLAMLSGAIVTGELQVNSKTSPSAIDGNYERSIVARSGLLAYAKAHGHRPEFLFPRRAPPITISQLAKQFGVDPMTLIDRSPLLQEATANARDAALEEELAEAEAAHRATKGQRPIYEKPPVYFLTEVPAQFKAWAKEQRDAGKTITLGRAQDAMRGRKDSDGKRTRGLLAPGRGLSRETIDAWVKSLPEEHRAKRGEPPSRLRR